MRRKKSILFSFLAVLILIFSTGYTRAEVGVKAGLNFSKMTGSVDAVESHLKYLSGFHAGVFYEFRYTERVSFLGELYYSQKGFKQTQSLEQDEYVVKLKIEYIDAVILAKYTIFDRGMIHPYVLGGAYGAFKLRAKNHAFTRGSDTAIVTDMGQFYTAFDYGPVGGLGVEYQWNDLVKSCLEIRYSMGLPDIYKNTGGGDIKFRNRVFSVMLGFSF